MARTVIVIRQQAHYPATGFHPLARTLRSKCRLYRVTVAAATAGIEIGAGMEMLPGKQRQHDQQRQYPVPEQLQQPVHELQCLRMLALQN